MKTNAFIFAAFMIAATVAVPAAADDADAILGYWYSAEGTESGKGKVRVEKVDGRYRGTIIWLEKPTYPADDELGMGGQQRVDRNNPDPELRAKPIEGLKTMDGFIYAGKKLWHKGSIYDPDNGKTYKCKVRLTDEGTLKVRGYIGISLIGRTTVWKPAPPPETETEE